MVVRIVLAKKASLSLLVSILIVMSSYTFSQQPAARITEAVDNSTLQRVAGSHHPLAIAANDHGRLPGDTPMERMVLILKPSSDQAKTLDKLINAQHDKQSAAYHNWLTPEQFGAQFGPAQQDLDQITAWLQQQGFRVAAIAHGKQWIEFSGSAAQVETTFHTEMHRYRAKGQDHVANATDISLPRALSPVVAGILSLHDFHMPANHSKAFQIQRENANTNFSRVSEIKPSSNGIQAVPTPDFSVGASTHFLAPGDFSHIYNTLPLLDGGNDGSGVSIAIVGRTDINLSDVQAFRQIFSLPPNDPEFIVNGADPGVNGDELESALDVEWAGAVAPKAKIRFVTTNSTFTTDGVSLSIAYIIDNVVAPIMSTSYSQCEAFLGPEGNAFFNSMYRQAAAEGITAFVSTGDNGPAACDFPESFTPALNGANVSGLASTPYNTAVGGTQFNERKADSTYWLPANRPDLSSAIGYIPETIWNESCDPSIDPGHCDGSFLYLLLAGSGGASSCTDSTISGNLITCISGYPKPSWQAGKGVPADGVRDIPDVSFTAAGHDGYIVCVEGACQWTVENGQIVLHSAFIVSGTSASTPSMAGVMALLEQKNGTYQGLANYGLYQMAASENLLSCNSRNLTDPNTVSNCVFYDVTSGNNSVPGQQGFSATRGYDMASGLGSVNVTNLVNGWTGAQKLGSATTLSTDTNTIQHGTPLPVNVGVQSSSGGGAPSGDFTIATQKYGDVFGGPLSNGSFSGGVSGLAGGHYSIKAHYSGDAMFNGSDSAAVPITVTPENSITTAAVWVVNLAGFVVPYYGPVNYGEPVAIQVNATGKSGVGSATGEATIMLDDTTNLGTFPLNQGGSGWVQVDNITASGLLPGTHFFRVLYNGDNSFAPSQSTRAGVVVRPVLPNGFASCYPDTVTVGTPVNIQFAVLSDGNLAPTGTINIYDNGKKVAGPIALGHQGLFGAGLAQFRYTASNLSVGFHQFDMTYSGDANHLPLPLHTFSNHGTFVSVNAATGAATHVVLSQSAGPVIVGQTVTYSVSVNPTKKGSVPTGTVTLVGENGGPFGDPVALINGSVSIPITWTFTANEGIVAAYSGDSNYSASDSGLLITNIGQGTPTVTLTAPAQVAAGAQSSVTVSTTGLPSNPNVSLPYGGVVFYDSLNGGAQKKLGSGFLTTGNGGNPIFTLPVTLSAGTHVIRVHYQGGFDWKPADSNVVAVVAQ